jgi:hypothetical protein
VEFRPELPLPQREPLAGGGALEVEVLAASAPVLEQPAMTRDDESPFKEEGAHGPAPSAVPAAARSRAARDASASPPRRSRQAFRRVEITQRRPSPRAADKAEGARSSTRRSPSRRSRQARLIFRSTTQSQFRQKRTEPGRMENVSKAETLEGLIGQGHDRPGLQRRLPVEAQFPAGQQRVNRRQVHRVAAPEQFRNGSGPVHQRLQRPGADGTRQAAGQIADEQADRIEAGLGLDLGIRQEGEAPVLGEEPAGDRQVMGQGRGADQMRQGLHLQKKAEPGSQAEAEVRVVYPNPPLRLVDSLRLRLDAPSTSWHRASVARAWRSRGDSNSTGPRVRPSIRAPPVERWGADETGWRWRDSGSSRYSAFMEHLFPAVWDAPPEVQYRRKPPRRHVMRHSTEPRRLQGISRRPRLSARPRWSPPFGCSHPFLFCRRESRTMPGSYCRTVSRAGASRFIPLATISQSGRVGQPRARRGASDLACGTSDLGCGRQLSRAIALFAFGGATAFLAPPAPFTPRDFDLSCLII